MICDLCRRAAGLQWLCCCDYGRDKRMVRYLEGILAEQQRNDPDAWYAEQVALMKDRAPA